MSEGHLGGNKGMDPIGLSLLKIQVECWKRRNCKYK